MKWHSFLCLCPQAEYRVRVAKNTICLWFLPLVLLVLCSLRLYIWDSASVIFPSFHQSVECTGGRTWIWTIIPPSSTGVTLGKWFSLCKPRLSKRSHNFFLAEPLHIICNEEWHCCGWWTHVTHGYSKSFEHSVHIHYHYSFTVIHSFIHLQSASQSINPVSQVKIPNFPASLAAMAQTRVKSLPLAPLDASDTKKGGSYKMHHRRKAPMWGQQEYTCTGSCSGERDQRRTALSLNADDMKSQRRAKQVQVRHSGEACDIDSF